MLLRTASPTRTSQLSPRKSHTKSPLRLEKLTTIAHAVDQRTNPSAMVLTMSRATLSDLLNSPMKAMERVKSPSKSEDFADANTTRQKADPSATAATNSLTGDFHSSLISHQPCYLFDGSI